MVGQFQSKAGCGGITVINTCEAEAGGSGSGQLHSYFKAGLDYMKPIFKNKNKENSNKFQSSLIKEKK